MRTTAPLFVVFASVLAVGVGGCNFDNLSPKGGTGGRIFVTGAGGAGGPCVNLQCRKPTCMLGDCLLPACPDGQTTSISGTVYDPAAKIPLYNAVVYVPNQALENVTEGASCDRCDALPSGNPVAKTTSDARGHFQIVDAPAGTNIPLVIQMGKWRRQTTISTVNACADNAITDKNLTRLPRNKSEGHIPRIALTTGGKDSLECLLRKIGIEDAEFTPESGTGRVNLFNGTGGTNKYDTRLNGGAMFTPAPTWWERAENLKKYDIILHSCEGVEVSTNKSAAALQAFKDYADAGGRTFASHFHNYWLKQGPQPLPTVATFNQQPDPTMNPFTATIDTSFDKGQAMAQWLSNVGGSTTPGQLDIRGAQHTVDAVGPNSQRWIYSDAAGTVQYLSFTTPLEVAGVDRCGKIVFSDIHVSSGSATATDDKSGPTVPFPTGCMTQDLTPQEKALVFMLFDLSACLDLQIG